MSTCNFSIPFSGPAETVLAKAKAAVESQNGDFSGDVNSGSFQVSVFGNVIRGNYNVSAQTLNLLITDKPFLVPCSTIESFLKSKIS
ncbi:hypothetical protein FW778_16105 [Ginsengibacter hankyongi]|uniref:Uncharacterized protein n=1 Tax=Ginsengibacter hankyongi TaxID=2607284 RepID=A0A5J5IGT2_9BACT|nr:hypothetical protein [Ginsengibacter hankyongi]KAA9037616.1 hypothetical protein FW778_16105 [Ginsengibacter hankyongi]